MRAIRKIVYLPDSNGYRFERLFNYVEVRSRYDNLIGKFTYKDIPKMIEKIKKMPAPDAR